MRGAYIFFFFNDTATTEIYPLSLHDALPIFADAGHAASADIAECDTQAPGVRPAAGGGGDRGLPRGRDRKSTRLNSSHSQISYAVFCLKKKKNTASHISLLRLSRQLDRPSAH